MIDHLLQQLRHIETEFYGDSDYKWASSWENLSSGVSDQVGLKLACSATEASMRLEILVTETRDFKLSKQWTIKALIRLRGCAGWSAPLLFAYDIRHVFSWPGSNIIVTKYWGIIGSLCDRLHAWPLTPSWLLTMLCAIIARRWIGPQTQWRPRHKHVGWCPMMSLVRPSVAFS